MVTASWPAFDQVNVQRGVDAWLAAGPVRHELLGLTGARYGHLDLADCSARPACPLLGSSRDRQRDHRAAARPGRAEPPARA